MKKTSLMRFANILAALIFAGVAVYAIVEAKAFKQFKNVPVGPEVFPIFMATGLILCCAALILVSLFSKNDEKAPTLSFRTKGMRRILIALGAVALFILLINKVGFLILAPILLVALMLLIDMKNYKMMVLVALVLTLLVWFLFYKVLVISIPLGPLEFLYDYV